MSDIAEQKPSRLAALLGRLFPKTPDFYGLLHEQSRQVVHAVGLLVRYMETSDAAIVNYCKDAVNEMDAFGLTPDAFTLDMAKLLPEGVCYLEAGFGNLGKMPVQASGDADRARKAERKVDKLCRRALAALFQGDDHVHMFKRREIYRHLTNAAECMAHCANTLHDIVVKTV
jgi:uncharacterized protein